MAWIYADRVLDTSVSTGTGSMVVSGTSPLGWRTFSTVCAVADTFYYTIHDPTTGAWETGEGTYSATNTVARTVFRASSTGAAVAFAANTKNVFLDVIGQYFTTLDADITIAANAVAFGDSTGAKGITGDLTNFAWDPTNKRLGIGTSAPAVPLDVRGAATLTGALTGTTTTMTGAIKAQSATALPAGGTAGAGFTFSSTTNFGMIFGSGAPTATMARGSLYLRSDGSPYVNLAGTATWGALATTTDLATTIPPGSIISYAGAAAPTGWLLCNGAAVSRTTYAALWTALGTTSSPYGQGDGSTTFNVPDLRGRVTAGIDGGTGRLPGYTSSGIAGGSDLVTLTIGQMPAHGHTVGGAIMSVNAYGTFYANFPGGSGGTAVYYFYDILGEGGSGAHPNVQPTIALNKIIKV